MHCFIRKLLFSFLLLSATRANADSGALVISPSAGGASISNIDGYEKSRFVRVDGSFYLQPQFGIGVFAARYPAFGTSGTGSNVSIKVDGYGAGLTGRWFFTQNVQAYVRAEYMQWRAEASGLNRTLAKDEGGSAGLAVGMHFPVNGSFGIKAEAAGYNDVSGADIRQLSLGLTFEL
jgi:hypothetical protein